MYLISKCLLGYPCRYDGGAKPHEKAIAFNRLHRCLAICPEQLGGLKTPRAPVEISGGSGKDVLLGTARVISQDGTDRTADFLKGAQRTLLLARQFRIKKAILKENSPSCGCHLIYDGSFSGRLTGGEGITAALLRENGIEILSEKDLDKNKSK